MAVKLSICIPTYNRAASFDRTMQKLNQIIEKYNLGDEVEIIVGVNGCLSSYEEVLKKNTTNSPNMHIVIHEENIGASRNFCSLLQVATGEYFWILSDDDEIAENLIPIVLNQATTNKPGLIYINAVERNGCIEKKYFHGEGGYFKDGKSKMLELNKNNSGGVLFITSNIFKREYFSNIDSNEIGLPIFMCMQLLFYIPAAMKEGIYIIDEPMIINYTIETSWQNRIYDVYVHDRFQTIEKLVEFGIDKKTVRKLCSDVLKSETGIDTIYLIYKAILKPGSFSDLNWFARRYPLSFLIANLKLLKKALVKVTEGDR